jgi:hypothetical protein
VGEKRDAYRVLVGKLEGMRPLARYSWGENTKVD